MSGASPLRGAAHATAAATVALLATLAILAPRPAAAVNALFQPDTARTLPRGCLEVGIFGPLRWGVTDRLELAFHPLLAFVAPQLDATFAWGEIGAVEVASHHGLLYPTPLMRLLAREGTGGIVPHDVTYPHILATSHHLRLSRALGAQLLTLRAGGRLARHLTRFDGPRFWSEVEWHLVRPRTAAWFSGWSVDAGLALEGPLWRSLGYRVALDGFLMPGLRGDKAAEGTVLATWRPRATLQLRLGAMLSWCEFPYGNRLSIPLPLADLAWSFDAPWERR